MSDSPSISFEPLRSALSTLRACKTPEHAMWAMCPDVTIEACVQFLEAVRAATAKEVSIVPTLDATPRNARLLLTALLVHTHPSFLDDASEREAPDGRDGKHEGDDVTTAANDHALSPPTVRKALAQTVAANAERFVETVANRHLAACMRALVTFRTSFEAWKRADREALVDVLVASYVNLSASIAEMDAVAANTEVDVVPSSDDSPTPTTLRDDLCASLRGLETKAVRLGITATAFHARVAGETPLPVSSDEEDDAEEDDAMAVDPRATAWSEAVAAVASTCERAFWDAFTAKLQAGDLTPLRAQLNEVVAKLKALTPNRTDMHATLDRAVDVDLVVQMAEHDALDTRTFNTLADTLVNTLISLQAPAATSATKAWIATWRAQWCDGTHAYAKQLPPFFAALHRDIDAVSDACVAVRATLE